MKRRRTSGATLVEVMVSAVISIGVLAAGYATTSSTVELSRSSANEEAAARRASRALTLVCDELRRCSAATILKSDGTEFASGTTTSGIQMRRVLGYRGSVLLQAAATTAFVLPSGATEGTIVRTVGTYEQPLVRGVTAFTITRNGDLYTISISTRSGPSNDRGRTFQSSITTRPRNP